MSVLVKGMGMPSSCGFCVMLDEDDKNFCYAEMRETTIEPDRPEWCPLVEVSDGQEEWLDGMNVLYGEGEDAESEV